jgi:hypothetical protein
VYFRAGRLIDYVDCQRRWTFHIIDAVMRYSAEVGGAGGRDVSQITKTRRRRSYFV